jgi:hypothetical protein
MRSLKFRLGSLLMGLGLLFFCIGDWLYWTGKPMYHSNRKRRK